MDYGHMAMRVAAVIPARYASSRLEGKVLLPIGGKPMVQWVYEHVREAIPEVWVATDDLRVKEAVEAFGGRVVVTPPCRSGTDRVALVAKGLEVDLILNVQADEPLIRPEMIERALQGLCDDPGAPVGSLKTPLDPQRASDPHVVKVVTDFRDRALYFSRSPIPHLRHPGPIYKHLGLYVYRREFLLRYPQLEPTPLELAEDLEQLRVLEHGWPIVVPTTPHDTVGVDTPEDLELVRKMMA